MIIARGHLLKRINPRAAFVCCTISATARSDKLSAAVVAIAICIHAHAIATDSSNRLWWTYIDLLQACIRDTVHQCLLPRCVECALRYGIVIWGINDVHSDVIICEVNEF